VKQSASGISLSQGAYTMKILETMQHYSNIY
jgi:hypothetical protein